MKIKSHKLKAISLLLLLSSGLLFAQPSIDELKHIYPASYGNWKLSPKFQVFDSENLYDYIDGGADNYISYDFQKLLVGIYEHGENKYINVEIYIHKGLPQAFGIYSSEKSSDASFEQIGAQGYQGDDFCNFFTGNYYVKITTHETGNEIKTLIHNMAIDFAKKLVANPVFPPIFSHFPKQGQVANSESFINTNFLGYEVLHSAFQVTYKVKDKSYRVFIIENKTAESAKAMIEGYAKSIKTSIADISKVQELKDPYNGLIIMKCKENYIWGIVNDQNVKVNKEIMSSIENSLFKK